MELKVEINSPIWEKIKLVESEAAEALFFAHFNELIFNAFKYADFTKPITLDFGVTQINTHNFLTYEWTNHSRDSGWCGSQLGLDSIKSDLTKLNGTDYSVTNAQK